MHSPDGEKRGDRGETISLAPLVMQVVRPAEPTQWLALPSRSAARSSPSIDKRSRLNVPAVDSTRGLRSRRFDDATLRCAEDVTGQSLWRIIWAPFSEPSVVLTLPFALYWRHFGKWIQSLSSALAISFEAASAGRRLVRTPSFRRPAIN